MIAWQEHGYRLIGEASDGEQALEICRRSAPDILITDMKMPRMDGIALLRVLQKEKIQMYVIILSGYDDFQLVREAMRLGAADYLLKLELEPCKLLDVLSTRIKQLSRKRLPQYAGAGTHFEGTDWTFLFE